MYKKKENSDSNNSGPVRIVSSSLLNTQLNSVLQPSPIHKLILYKPPPGGLIDGSSPSGKSLKIVSTTPIMSNNKPLLLNTKPSTTTQTTTTILQSFKQEEVKVEDQTKLFELVVSTESPQSSIESLKRKRSLSSSENSPIFKEDSPSSLTLSISPPNWTEKNLQFIKEMLDKLHESDFCGENKDGQILAIESDCAAQLLQQQQEQKRELRILCERIKEKLEKNVYECVDELNNDLKIVKERCVGDEENETSSKRLKLFDHSHSLVPPTQSK